MIPYRAEIQMVCERHGLDPDLVEAICMTESSGETAAYRYEPNFWLNYMAHKPEWKNAIPRRVSASYGLLQILYPTALTVGYPIDDPPEFLFVPVVGLDFGCRFLKTCKAWAKGDVEAMLAAYNGGRTLDNSPGVSPKRNQVYVDKVLKNLQIVKSAG